MRYFAGCIIILLFFSAGCRQGGDGDGVKSPADSAGARLETLNKQILEDEDNPDLYHLRAKLFYATRDFDKAFRDIRKAISLSSSRPAYYITLSDIYLLSGQPENCKESLTKAIDLDPENADALLKLAKLYLIMKDYPACFETSGKLLKIDPANWGAYYTRAIGLLEKGDTVRAVADLQKAVENNQQYFDAFLQLGELYAIKKDRLAEMYFRNALNLNPQSKQALYMLGLHYQETGAYDQAISTYSILQKSDTAFRDAPYNIGYIYLVYLKDFSKATDYFSQAIAIDPGYYQAWFNRGYAWELAGELQKAREDYQKTLKVKVNYDKAIEGLNRLDKAMIRN